MLALKTMTTFHAGAEDDDPLSPTKRTSETSATCSFVYQGQCQSCFSLNSSTTKTQLHIIYTGTARLAATSVEVATLVVIQTCHRRLQGLPSLSHQWQLQQQSHCWTTAGSQDHHHLHPATHMSPSGTCCLPS
ncbi:uncharacterized protein [Macrobrachium rosenbergii]|uniref:uncharacterized protein isoform X2 n=1 Tax=Macrobrachium rosenbergii TaxID=79674 RepID=UPI0034D59526